MKVEQPAHKVEQEMTALGSLSLPQPNVLQQQGMSTKYLAEEDDYDADE